MTTLETEDGDVLTPVDAEWIPLQGAAPILETASPVDAVPDSIDEAVAEVRQIEAWGIDLSARQQQVQWARERARFLDGIIRWNNKLNGG